jgi:hypothetical protein
MDLASTYHFADFTRTNYRALLRLARRAYTMVGYTDALPTTPSVLWRHDVDYSVHAAYALARIEAEEGVRATYFFRLHSEMYNLLEQPVIALAREITALGHEVGLHFDAAYHGITTEAALDDAIDWEASLLSRVLARPIVAMSFHQPDAFLLGCQQPRYAGLINTYAARFQREVGYVSDSNGYWRHRRLEDVLTVAAEPQLQVLTHPEWWTDAPMSPAERIERCIAGRAESMRAYYRDDMRRCGRLNVGAPASLEPPTA